MNSKTVLACVYMINYFRFKVQGDANSKIMLIIMCAHELHKVLDDINSKQCWHVCTCVMN